MTADQSDHVLANVRYLRRYARALHGSQQAGDTYVRLCLEALLIQRDALLATQEIKLQLFRLFHEVWRAVDFSPEELIRAAPELDIDFSIKARLEAIPAAERQVLLLTALENFSLPDVAYILDLSQAEVENLLDKAWRSISEQISTTVLIIEDDPLIADEISVIIGEMGHVTIGIATDQGKAIALARQKKPGLILADIDLGGGGSGLVAVQQILKSIDVPIIFITAHPEHLLTGERPEPTYLITKPYRVSALRVTVSQALSLKKSETASMASLRRAGGAS
jgi:CheY-like chemotaxis protein/DNA-directed RNA polymerase specialized sigma24 family protein